MLFWGLRRANKVVYFHTTSASPWLVSLIKVASHLFRVHNDHKVHYGVKQFTRVKLFSRKKRKNNL